MSTPVRQVLHMLSIFDEIGAERARQHAKFGLQDRKIVNYRNNANDVEQAKQLCEHRRRAGILDWETILNEELIEAYAEAPDSAEQRTELIQCAAVLVAMIENIDRRNVEAELAKGAA